MIIKMTEEKKANFVQHGKQEARAESLEMGDVPSK